MTCDPEFCTNRAGGEHAPTCDPHADHDERRDPECPQCEADVAVAAEASDWSAVR